MPGKTTFFSRIQALLELSSARKPRSTADLIENIARRSPLNFVYHRRNAETEEVEGHCSVSSITKTLNLAVELELIDPQTGGLTKQGKEAADPSRYDMIIRRGVISYLGAVGCSISDLEKTILNGFASQPISLPTADKLYDQICLSKGLDLSITKFSILLKLLAECGGIDTNRKQIFLPRIK